MSDLIDSETSNPAVEKFQWVINGEVIRECTYDQVLYFAAEDKWVSVYHCRPAGVIIVRETLRSVKDRLPSLIQTDRKHLVDHRRIVEVQRNPAGGNWRAILFDGTWLPVSRRERGRIEWMLAERKATASKVGARRDDPAGDAP